MAIGRTVPAASPRLSRVTRDRAARGEPHGRGRLRGREEGAAADEERRAVPRARARRPERAHRGARVERRRAARRALRRGRRGARARPRREVPRPAPARRAHARAGGGRRSRPRWRRRCGATRTSSRASSSSSSRRSRIPGCTTRSSAVLDTETRARDARAAGDARRPPLAMRAGCSSTRSASRRSAARRRSCISGCASTCCSRRRSCTTSAGRASSGAAPVFRPTDEGRLLGHVHLGLRLIEERAPALDAGVRAELLHAVVVPSRRPRRAHRRGGGALPREPARRGRGDEARRRLTGILLALAASLVVGRRGLRRGRRVAQAAGPLVIAATQTAGLVFIAIVVAIFRPALPTGAQFAWGALAGAVGVFGLTAFYRGPRRSARWGSSVRSARPAWSCRSRTGSRAASGRRRCSSPASALAVVGVIAASIERHVEHPRQPDRRRCRLRAARRARLRRARSIALSKAAAGGALWAPLSMRAVGVPLILIAVLFLRPPTEGLRAAWWLLVGVGCLRHRPRTCSSGSRRRAGCSASCRCSRRSIRSCSSRSRAFLLHERIAKHQLAGVAVALGGRRADQRRLAAERAAQRGHRVRHEPVVRPRAAAARLDEPCLAQHLEVVRDRRLREVERRDEVADAAPRRRRRAG